MKSIRDPKQSTGKKFPKTWGAVLALLLMVGMLVVFLKRSDEGAREREGERRATMASEGGDGEVTGANESGSVVTMADVPETVPEWLGEELERLSRAMQPNSVLEELAGLRARLRGLPAEEAARGLLEFLESGADFQFGMDFGVGAGGGLSSWPTARVFALDLLGEMDRAEAGRYANEIFETHSSADEWAVALRDHALAGMSAEGGLPPDHRASVEARAQEMFRHAAWRENPTVGYYEAYDVVPFLRSVPLIETVLEGAVAEGRVEMPAMIALNKTITASPAQIAEVYPVLEAAGVTPAVRGQAVAMMDPSVPEQRAFMDAWAQEEANTSEIESFLKLFPTVGRFENHSLFDTRSHAAPAPLSLARLAGAADFLDAFQQSWSERIDNQLLSSALERAQSLANQR